MLSWALSGSEISIFLLPFEAPGNKMTKSPVNLNIFLPGFKGPEPVCAAEAKTAHTGTDTACCLGLSLAEMQYLTVMDVILSRKSKGNFQLARLSRRCWCLCLDHGDHTKRLQRGDEPSRAGGGGGCPDSSTLSLAFSGHKPVI